MSSKKITLIRHKVDVGYATLELEDDHSGFISDVKIYKKYRGYGYCSKLVHKIITTATKMKLKTLTLHVSSTNGPAIKCYKNNNFKIIRKNYNKWVLFGYTMRLKLKS